MGSSGAGVEGECAAGEADEDMNSVELDEQMRVGKESTSGSVVTCTCEVRVALVFEFVFQPSFLHPLFFMSKQATRQAITLKGSTALVTEFFKYAVNTSVFELAGWQLQPLTLFQRILFQREVYPSDDFHMVKKYGQTVLVTQDLALENYLERCAISDTHSFGT